MIYLADILRLSCAALIIFLSLFVLGWDAHYILFAPWTVFHTKALDVLQCFVFFLASSIIVACVGRLCLHLSPQNQMQQAKFQGLKTTPCTYLYVCYEGNIETCSNNNNCPQFVLILSTQLKIESRNFLSCLKSLPSFHIKYKRLCFAL